MRSYLRVLGLLGPLGGCFVDPGSASGGTGTGTGGSSTGLVVTGGVTGETDASSGSTTSGSSTGEASTGAVVTTEEGTSTGSSDDTGVTGTGEVEVPVPGCVPLYFTDFLTDPATATDLTLAGGEWLWDPMSGTVTVTTEEGGSSRAATTGMWKDATVHARLRVASGHGVVRMREQAEPDHATYFTSIDPVEQVLEMGKFSGGEVKVFQTDTLGDVSKEWNTLTLRLSASGLTSGINNEVLVDDEDGELAEGRASIGGYGAGVAEFDWFLVCAPD